MIEIKNQRKGPILTALTLATTLALFTGCKHKSAVAPPPPVPVPLPQPVAGLKALPAILPTSAPSVVLYQPAPKPKDKHRHEHARRKYSTDLTNPAKTPTAASPSNGQEPSSITPIGLLTTAPESISKRDASSIEDQIHSIDDRVHAIHSALTISEEQTVTEIQTFLKKAQNALQNGDLDGAHTLTVKAQVLLSELHL